MSQRRNSNTSRIHNTPCLRAARRSAEHRPGFNNTTLGCDVVARLIEYVFSRFSVASRTCDRFTYDIDSGTRLFSLRFYAVRKHRSGHWLFTVFRSDDRNYRTKPLDTSGIDEIGPTAITRSRRQARGRKHAYVTGHCPCSDLVRKQFNLYPHVPFT